MDNFESHLDQMTEVECLKPTGSTGSLGPIALRGVGRLSDIMGVKEAQEYLDEKAATQEVLRRQGIRLWVIEISHSMVYEF